MHTLNATARALADLGGIVAEVATLAMTHTLSAFRAMSTPDAVLAPQIYLSRHSCVEHTPMQVFDPERRQDWVFGSLLPILITTGAIDVLALVHGGKTSAPVRREVAFLHVFSAERDEHWHAGVFRRHGRIPTLGSWRLGADGALSERTLEAIRAALDRSLADEPIGVR